MLRLTRVGCLSFRRSDDDVRRNRRRPDPDATNEELDKIVVKRVWLEQHCYEPYFDDLIRNCLLRLSIGQGPSGQNVYRIVRGRPGASFTFFC